MENITGVVERITYQNEETGYGVIKVRVKGFSELATFTGKFVSINVGTIIEAKGNFTHCIYTTKPCFLYISL